MPHALAHPLRLCAPPGSIEQPSRFRFDGAPYVDGTVDRSFLGEFTPQLYIPGNPPHPLTFVNGLLDLLGIKK